MCFYPLFWNGLDIGVNVKVENNKKKLNISIYPPWTENKPKKHAVSPNLN